LYSRRLHRPKEATVYSGFQRGPGLSPDFCSGSPLQSGTEPGDCNKVSRMMAVFWWRGPVWFPDIPWGTEGVINIRPRSVQVLGQSAFPRFGERILTLRHFTSSGDECTRLTALHRARRIHWTRPCWDIHLRRPEGPAPGRANQRHCRTVDIFRCPLRCSGLFR